MLKEKGVNVSDAAYLVGFNDHTYFTRSFKKAFNLTPSEYVKKLKGN